MSKFFDAFKRQVGRDTGKAVSNFVLGDKHSTPYRNTNVKNKINGTKLVQNDVKVLHIKNDIYSLDKEVISSVNQVISIQIPENEKEIIKILRELEIQLSINRWLPIHRGEIARIRNKYPDAVLKKYEHCLLELVLHSSDESRQLNIMKKIFLKYRIRRFLYKYQLYLFIFSFLILFLIIGFNAN